MKLLESRDRFLPAGPAIVILVMGGLVLMGMLLFQNWTWFQRLHANVPELDTCRHIRADLTTALLQYNEAIEAENDFDPGNILVPIDHAYHEIGNLLASSSVQEDARVEDFIDSRALDLLSRLKVSVEQFRTELESTADPEVTPTVDPGMIRRLDILAGNVELEAMAFEQSLSQNLGDRISGQQTVFGLIMFAWLGIGVLVAFLLVMVFRNHRRISQTLLESQQMFQSVISRVQPPVCRRFRLGPPP
jgi:hypothetical protein